MKIDAERMLADIAQALMTHPSYTPRIKKFLMGDINTLVAYIKNLESKVENETVSSSGESVSRDSTPS